MDKFDAFNNDPPPQIGLNGEGGGRLFHFTTNQGLVGILRTKSLWATKLRYLNDSEEFIHGLEIATRIAREKAESAVGIDREILEEITKTKDRFEKANVFVTSFTEEGDLLSQWRGYAVNGGASLSFSATGLQEIAARNGFRLLKCVYDHDQKRRFATGFIEQAVSRFKAMQETSSDLRPQDGAWWFAHQYFQAAATFKNPAFKEEREWRLISGLVNSNDERIDFRTGSSFLIPYFSLDLALREGRKPSNTNIGLQEIVIGPTQSRLEMLDAVSLAVERFGIEVASISCSDAPYRSV